MVQEIYIIDNKNELIEMLKEVLKENWMNFILNQ